MMGTEGISVTDALALRNAGENDGMFGNNAAWWIIILILFLGGGLWGGNRDRNNYDACCTPATAQGVNDAFNFNQLDNGVRGLERGMCDGFYTMNNNMNSLAAQLQNCCCQTQLGMTQGFNGINQSIANLGFQTQQGFCGVDKGILQSDFHNQAGFNALSNQLSSCCCDLQRGQDNLKYELSTDTNAILIANERNTNKIIDYLTQSEMDRLRTELQSAQFQLSQLSQTSNIVNQLMPVAKPAYITCSPYASALGYNYNYNCGCGCTNCA